MAKRLVVAVAVLVALSGLPAGAHVDVTEEVTSGDTAVIDFRVGHGCDGSPTVRVSVAIPPGVAGVTPQVKPGWEVSVEEGALPEPVTVHGEEVTDGVLSVTWEGGRLPDGAMDVFSMSGVVAVEPGREVYFPVVQQCEDGEHRWVQVPAEGEDPDALAEPAPAVGVVEGSHDESSGTDPLTFVALVVAAVALVVGLAALAVARR